LAQAQAAADFRSELDKAVAYWGEQYARNPQDRQTAISYAKNLKAAGQKQMALRVLQQASPHHGSDRELASEYGRLALEFGQVNLAQKLLAVAYDPANPDWRAISAQGTVPVLGSTPIMSYNMMSCMVTTSPSMPSTSVMCVILREPSRKREACTMMSTAPVIISRMVFVGRVFPPIMIM